MPPSRPLSQSLIAAPEAPAQIAAALDEQGVDIVVHNAGITKDKTIAKMTDAAWQSVIDINLSAQERIDDALLAAGILRDGGRIVNISSGVTKVAFPGMTSYAAAKGAVEVLTLTLAQTLGSRGITVNAVSPGTIETDIHPWMADPAAKARAAGFSVFNRVGQPDDVADVVADVDVRVVLAQRHGLLLGPQAADHGVRLDAEVRQVQLRVRLVLGGDDDRPPAGPAHGGHRLAGAGQRERGLDRVRRVDLPVQVGDGLDLLGREPVRQLLGQRRPEPGDGQVGVHVRPGAGAQLDVAGADAGP